MTNTQQLIHSTAIIYPGAEIGPDCQIGPYSIIGPHVKIGAGNIIGPHVVIEGNTTLGDENKVFQFASVGSQPQDLKYHGEPSTLVMGNKNTIREYSTLQPGTEGGGMLTKVGNGNLFMVGSHVGHDAIIGDACVFANNAALAGHVQIGNRVIIGGLSGVHQFVRLGDLCILGAGSMVAQDVPPFFMVQGDRAEACGLNVIGLRRSGFGPKDIDRLRAIYKKVLLEAGTLSDKLVSIKSEAEGFEPGERLYNFLSVKTKRGIVHHRRNTEMLEHVE